jgi:hypothetical protein
MDPERRTALERAFAVLSRVECETIIRHGVALWIADLQQRLFAPTTKLQSDSDFPGVFILKPQYESLPGS